MLVPVEIASFAVDPARNSPLIIIKETSGQRTLALPIGPLEASAIAIQSLNVQAEKPLTVDLVKLVMNRLGGSLTRVIIYDYDQQAFLARLCVSNGTAIDHIDCRPCDALALAIRCAAPIFVEDKVFAKSSKGESLSESEMLRRHIGSLDTADFGRYYLE